MEKTLSDYIGSRASKLEVRDEHRISAECSNSSSTVVIQKTPKHSEKLQHKTCAPLTPL